MRDVDLSVSYGKALEKLRKKPAGARRIETARVPTVKKSGWPTEDMSPEPYEPGLDLVRVTDLAIALQRPLLLQGEPGCGKTRLAYSVAYALGLPLEIAYVKSTSRAQDLLDSYDAVRRLYDSQLGAKRSKSKKPAAALAAGDYIELGPLGRAIARAEYNRRSVVLIDEIDKADLDFPNDLLWELDRMEFDVPEAPEHAHRARGVRPIVIITHNEEKPLPAAFLRRCVYYYVDYPKDRAEVERILKLHGVNRQGMAEKAAELIEKLREKDFMKKPGLAELIDWVRHEDRRGTTPQQLAALPNVEVLMKDRGDQDRVKKDLAAS